jgi:hypothetical protein
MLILSAFPVLILSMLAIGPYQDSLSPIVENLAQLGAVLSLFVLVCALEAGSSGRRKDPV